MRHPLRSHLLVFAQFGSVVGCLWPPSAGAGGSPAWLAACLVGAGFGIWTLAHNRIGNFNIYPEHRDGARLVTSGPYRCSRHPMYVALAAMMAGVAAYNGALHNAAALALLLLVLHLKALIEEPFLQAAFSGYRSYAERTPRYLGRRRQSAEHS